MIVHNALRFTAVVESYIVWRAGFDLDGSVLHVLIRHCIGVVSTPNEMKHFFPLSYHTLAYFDSISPTPPPLKYFLGRHVSCISVQNGGSPEFNFSRVFTSVCKARQTHHLYLTICHSFKPPHVTLHRRRLESEHVQVFYLDVWKYPLRTIAVHKIRCFPIHNIGRCLTLGLSDHFSSFSFVVSPSISNDDGLAQQ